MAGERNELNRGISKPSYTFFILNCPVPFSNRPLVVAIRHDEAATASASSLPKRCHLQDRIPWRC